jgi:hypothetical protein
MSLVFLTCVNVWWGRIRLVLHIDECLQHVGCITCVLHAVQASSPAAYADADAGGLHIKDGASLPLLTHLLLLLLQGCGA